MKITNIKIEKNMLRVKTDYKNGKEFVYLKDKFENKEELITEIENSITEREKKQNKQNTREQNILN